MELMTTNGVSGVLSLVCVDKATIGMLPPEVTAVPMIYVGMEKKYLKDQAVFDHMAMIIRSNGSSGDVQGYENDATSGYMSH
jgi:hypothetical protein